MVQYEKNLQKRLRNISWAPSVFTTALSGQRVGAPPLRVADADVFDQGIIVFFVFLRLNKCITFWAPH